MMDITVAICTYKRHDLLRTTLDSLRACESPDCAWELIVIDNECHDAVRGLVESFAGTMGVPVRYVAEQVTGTSHARNRAVAEASAPIVLFTDDDVTFHPHWLSRMWQQIRSQPECQFWGGTVVPVWDGPRPGWFEPAYCAMLGDTIVQYSRGEVSRQWDPAKDPPFYTANLALRTAAIRAAGGFDTSVGHRGDVRMGMEDSLMVKSISKAGGTGWYAAEAVVNHPVPAARMERKYARQFAWRQGWLSAEMTRRGGDLGGKPAKMPRWFYRMAMSNWARGFALMFAGLFTLNPARQFGGWVTMVFNFSKLWHAVKG